MPGIAQEPPVQITIPGYSDGRHEMVLGHEVVAAGVERRKKGEVALEELMSRDPGGSIVL